ncbi:unnamed protein product [Urochloa humidicola]
MTLLLLFPIVFLCKLRYDSLLLVDERLMLVSERRISGDAVNVCRCDLPANRDCLWRGFKSPGQISHAHFRLPNASELKLDQLLRSVEPKLLLQTDPHVGLHCDYDGQDSACATSHSERFLQMNCHLDDRVWYCKPKAAGVLSSGIDMPFLCSGHRVLISNKAKHSYHFDTVKRTWRKAGNWPMPFTLLAEYVPKHGLWFGLSSKSDGYGFLAANLMAPADSEEMSPPVVHGCWKEYVQPPPEWSLLRSYVVHLGSSKFCIVRFFEVGKLQVCPETQKTYMVEEELQAVLTGVEVEGCDQELQVFKYKSERYKLNIQSDYWVL